MADCLKQTKVFYTNYDKVIQLFLDTLTSLSVKYNKTNLSSNQKKYLREDIGLIEELLRLKSLSKEFINDKNYQSIKNYLEELIEFHN